MGSAGAIVAPGRPLLLRPRSAMNRRLRPASPRMRMALLVLDQEFQLLGRDPIPVLRMLLDHGLSDRARILGTRVRRARVRP